MRDSYLKVRFYIDTAGFEYDVFGEIKRVLMECYDKIVVEEATDRNLVGLDYQLSDNCGNTIGDIVVGSDAGDNDD